MGTKAIKGQNQTDTKAPREALGDLVQCDGALEPTRGTLGPNRRALRWNNQRSTRGKARFTQTNVFNLFIFRENTR